MESNNWLQDSIEHENNFNLNRNIYAREIYN